MSEKEKPKRRPGRPKSDAPKGRSPKYIVHAGIDPTIGEAVERFLDSQRLKPTMTSFVELAFMEFLEREGFWEQKKSTEE